MSSFLLQRSAVWLGPLLLAAGSAGGVAQAQTPPLMGTPIAPTIPSAPAATAMPVPSPASAASPSTPAASAPTRVRPASATPVVRRVEAPVIRESARPASTPPAASDSRSAVKQALQMQRDGRHAGPPRPMLGITAQFSLQRYRDSFKHPIPEFFEPFSATEARP